MAPIRKHCAPLKRPVLTAATFPKRPVVTQQHPYPQSKIPVPAFAKARHLSRRRANDSASRSALSKAPKETSQKHDDDEMPGLYDDDYDSDPESAPNKARTGKSLINNLTIIESQLLPMLTVGLEKPAVDKETKPSMRHRDLPPMPVPANERIELAGSRSVQRRLLCGSHVSGIVRDSIVALNSLCVGSASAERNNSHPLTAAQEDVVA